MALIYKPIKKENVERSWKTTLGLEIITDWISQTDQSFDKFFKTTFKNQSDDIKLKESFVKITYYSKGEERVINEIPSKIQAENPLSE